MPFYLTSLRIQANKNAKHCQKRVIQLYCILSRNRLDEKDVSLLNNYINQFITSQNSKKCEFYILLICPYLHSATSSIRVRQADKNCLPEKISTPDDFSPVKAMHHLSSLEWNAFFFNAILTYRSRQLMLSNEKLLTHAIA